MSTKVYFKGSKDQAKILVNRLRNMLTGREPDSQGIARSFQAVLGFAALTDIKDAFVIKSRKGTDDMGITWPKLKPETVANRRVGPGDLAVPTIKLRQDVQKRFMNSKAGKELHTRLKLSLPPAQAKARFRLMAGQLTTGKTGLTKLVVLGYRDVDILRDTGVLLNSLTPGQLRTNGGYSKPSGKGGDEQIFDLLPGKVIIGTTVEYASAHQYGNPKKNLPQRQFLPKDGAQVPQSWWDRWLALASQALELAAAKLFD